MVPEHCWSQSCQNLFGDNCALRAKATTVRGSKGEKGVSNRWAAYLMEVDVLRMLRYCRMSGTVIRRNARRNRSPWIRYIKRHHRYM